MKLIEAMKRLRVIEKRMEKNVEYINRYASTISSDKPLFDTEEKQRREVKALIQSNQDLMNEYLILKKKIESTNLSTVVSMGGFSYTISDLLVIKRRLAKLMMATFEALNENQGRQREKFSAVGPDGKRPYVVRFYNEEERNEGLRKWQELADNIDSRLEVLNAMTTIVNE